MKKTIKKIFSLVIVFCMACVGLISTPIVGAKAAGNYVETSFGEGKMLITTTFDGSTYYLPATTTSSGPLAKSFTEVSEIEEDHLWTVTATGSNYYIQNSEGKYLYTTNTNNGVRVGDTANAWNYDTSANSFKDTATSRYLGIYSASNWRCYTTVNQTNYKESSTSFKFYKVNAAAPSVTINGDDSYTQVGAPITLTAELANVSGEVAWASTNTDVATVAGGEVTPIAMGKTTITATVGEASDSMDVTVYPVAASALTIAEALQVCELTGETNAPYTYSTTGVIESIDTAYDSTNDRITVTITDGTDSIQAYRMDGGGDLEVGTQITVTGTLVNYKSNTPEFDEGGTYEIVVDETAEEIKSALNAVNAYMSLSYKYKETTQETVIPSEKKVSFEFGENGTASHYDGSSKTSYTETVGDYTLELTEGTSMYTGARDAKGNSCIKLGTGSKTGGFSFTVPDGVTSVIIAVAKYKANTSKLTINGTSYTLTNNSDNGEYDKIMVDTRTTKDVVVATVSDGIRAMVNSITFVVPTNEGGTKTETVLTDSEFRFRCGVDANLLDLKDVVDAYGIRVTTNDKTANYTDTATSWATDAENGMVYVIIGLGDIIDDIDKLTTEFTVQAYVVYDGVTYLSTSTKTYSVASIVEEYYGSGEDVGHLYNYLQENNQEAA